MTPRILTLTVPKASPSLNTFNGKHWSVYREQKKLWLKMLWVAKAQAEIYGLPMIERANVSIERFGAKSLDEDNLAGGVKMLVDSLRSLGLIEDDSPAHIKLSVAQHLSKNIRTVIRIEELARAVC